MADLSNQLIESLDSANTTPTKENCLNQLARVSELVFERDRTFELLDRFCYKVVETFQRHRNQDVRVRALTFMKKATTAGASGMVGRVRAQLVPCVMQALIYLVQDSATKVARRAVALATGLVRRAMLMVFSAPPSASEGVERTWSQLQDLVRVAAPLVASAPPEVRVAAVKLVEILALSFSFPSTNAPQRAVRHGKATLGPNFVTLRHLPPSSAVTGGHRFLERTAIAERGSALHEVLAELVGTARATPASARAAPVQLSIKTLIVAVNGIALTAAYRPHFTARSVKAFVQLHATLALASGNPGAADWLSEGQKKCVRQSVRVQLTKLLKIRHAWDSRDAIVALLKTLNAPESAISASLEMCRKLQSSGKRSRNEDRSGGAGSGPSSKRTATTPLIERRQLEAIPEQHKSKVLADLVIANMANLGKKPAGGASSPAAQAALTALTTLLSGLGGSGLGATPSATPSVMGGAAGGIGTGGALVPIAVPTVLMSAEEVSRQHLRAFKRLLRAHAETSTTARGSSSGMIGVLTRIAVESGIAPANAFLPAEHGGEDVGLAGLDSMKAGVDAADSILKRSLAIPMHVVFFADHVIEDITPRLELAVSLLHGFFAASVVQHRLRAAAGGASATGGGGRGSSNMRAYNYIFQRIVIALRHRFFDGDDSAVAGLAGLMRRAPAFPEIAVEMLFSFCTAEVLIEPENGRAAAKAAAVQAIKREEIRRVQAILPILLAVINQRPTARESCVSALLSHTDHSKAALSDRCVRIVTNILYTDQRFTMAVEVFARRQIASLPAASSTEESAAEESSSSSTTVLGAAATAAVVTELTAEQIGRRIGLLAAIAASRGCAPAQRAQLVQELLGAYAASSDAVKEEFHRPAPAGSTWFVGSMCSLIKDLSVGSGGPARAVRLLFRDASGGAARSSSSSSSSSADGSDMLVVLALKWLVDGSSSSHGGGATSGGSEESVLTPDFVAAVKELHAQSATRNFRLLLPVLPALDASEVTNALPTLVMLVKEQPIMVADAFKRLTRHVHAESGKLSMPPADLFVALHVLNQGVGQPCPLIVEGSEKKEKEEGVTLDLASVLLAIELCLGRNYGMRETFLPVVVVAALNRLASVPPPQTPKLLMRTMLLALQTGMPPKLVVKLLSTFAESCTGVWAECDADVWNGFLRCLYTTQPDCFPVIVTLPTAQLNEALAFEAVTAEEQEQVRAALTKWAREEIQIGRPIPDAAKACLSL